MNADWRLTITDVIKRPLFQCAEVVAGSRGLAKPIRWVHVLETAENGHFLNGGELILSTGFGFGEAAGKRLAYLAEVIRRDAVGLCIELGPYIPRIPADMRELADHHDFPLIAFHQPVRFVDITLDLHEIIVNRQMQALRKLESYSRELQQLSLRAQGIPRLLQHLQSTVQSQAFFYPLEGTPLYLPAMAQSVQTELNGLLREVLPLQEPVQTASGVHAISDKKQLVYQQITAMGHLLAYLGVVLYEREAEEFLLLLLDYTASAMAQILMRNMFAAEQALASENRMFDDLLADRLTNEEQIRSLLGILQRKKTPAYYAMILQLQWSKEKEEESAIVPPHELVSVFRSILSRAGFRAFIRLRGNRFYLLLIETAAQPKSRAQLQQTMAEMRRVARRALADELDVIFGVSRPSDRYAEIRQHFQQAEQALAFHADLDSPFFEDLAVYRLLFHLPRENVLSGFIADYLGPLIQYDKANGSQLLKTLRVYLDCSLSKQEAAERLYIHRQTLYHRLEKIRECLGERYLSPEHRLCVEIALRAYEWTNRNSYG
jgi:purine catabolism regulator